MMCMDCGNDIDYCSCAGGPYVRRALRENSATQDKPSSADKQDGHAVPPAPSQEGHGAGPASSGGTLAARLRKQARQERASSEFYGSEDVADMCEQAAAELDSLIAALEGARKETDAIRELMNVYNLGGWTDAIGPMKRALAAEAALAAEKREAEKIILLLTADHNSGPNYEKGFEMAKRYLAARTREGEA